MTQQEIIELNTKRVQIQLQKFLSQLRPEILEYCKHLRFEDNLGKECTLDDIDFNNSCLFICDVDILNYVSIYALQKINKVLYPDTTLSGHYSIIRTDYLVVPSTEIRYSKMDLSSVELEEVPEMYKPTSFLYKKLCIWDWVQDVGQGDNQSMYRFCNERLRERYDSNLLDWVFFRGTYEQFKNTYNTILPIPIYRVIADKVDDVSEKDKKSKKLPKTLTTLKGKEDSRQ